MYISLSTPDANCLLLQLINCLLFLLLPHCERIKTVFPIPLLTQYITYALSTRNLEGICSNIFNFRERISQICRTCYSIRNLRHISRHSLIKN